MGLMIALGFTCCLLYLGGMNRTLYLAARLKPADGGNPSEWGHAPSVIFSYNLSQEKRPAM